MALHSQSAERASTGMKPGTVGRMPMALVATLLLASGGAPQRIEGVNTINTRLGGFRDGIYAQAHSVAPPWLQLQDQQPQGEGNERTVLRSEHWTIILSTVWTSRR